MTHRQLPQQFSKTTEHLFAAYEHLWEAKGDIEEKMGQPYWNVARGALMSILTASMEMDDPSIKGKLRTITKPQPCHE